MCTAVQHIAVVLKSLFHTVKFCQIGVYRNIEVNFSLVKGFYVQTKFQKYQTEYSE